MNTSMKTTFMSDQDMSQVQSILDRHGLSGFDASIRLWGRGKAIEVKGTLGKQELSCLLAIASFLGDDGEDASSLAANESSMQRSSAGASSTLMIDVAPTAHAAAI